MAKLKRTAKQVQAAANQASDVAQSPAASKSHSFSRTIAKEHGEKAAVLLQFLAHHVTKPI